MHIRIIRTEDAYRTALAHVEQLAMQDPEHGSKEAEELELLALLIEDFEKKHYSFDRPDPISAIEFRMEEQGLRQKDLIPLLGSRSRVSEVLSRKRPLTLPMIRSLSEGLGIPTDLLIQPVDSAAQDQVVEPEWSKLPFREMQKRGWIPQGKTNNPAVVEQMVRDFLASAGQALETVPLYRRNLRGLGLNPEDERGIYSTLAWTARVLQRSNQIKGIKKGFRIDDLSDDFLLDLARLSRHTDGPIRAINELAKVGITVIVEPSLPSTLIDGAAMLNKHLQPVIGLTLRYDRVDYFWFTLMHEVAHVWKHLNTPKDAFVDRMDAGEERERTEKEANRIAREALIPRSIWNRSIAKLNPSTDSINHFALEIGVHPAIVAGRVRHETGAFNRYASLLGQGTVRKLFNGIYF
jgi:HTH-type transcriptional regulator / antitoxin HigA